MTTTAKSVRLVPSRLIFRPIAQTPETAWTDEAQARDCRPDLGFPLEW
jgi:hypothetical protein